MRPRAPSVPGGWAKGSRGHKEGPARGEEKAPAPDSGTPDTTRLPVGVDYREEMPTFSDPAELEAARIKSTFTTIPPPETPRSAVPHELSEHERVAGYERLLGGFDRVPIVVVPSEELASRQLDPRASMLVALLDGRSTVRDILDIGIMNTLDTLAGLADLLERGVMSFRGR